MALTEDFKNALASWASGVSVVATRAEGHVYGITVSSFTSLSLEPPLILVCLNKRNRLGSMIESAGVFTVSILAAEQASVSNHFASSGREPTETFEPVAQQDAPSGLPIVAGAMAYVDCALHRTLDEGDHSIVIGRVTAAGARSDAGPLLYCRRGYRQLAEPAESRGDADRPAEEDIRAIEFETLFHSF
jgi:flavin reductase (DIM6/NTAB) family NADH-FMN oxidoreductase RutF